MEGTVQNNDVTSQFLNRNNNIDINENVHKENETTTNDNLKFPKRRKKLEYTAIVVKK